MLLLGHCSTKFRHSPGYHALIYLLRLLLFFAVAMSGAASRDQMKETLRAFLEWMRAADPKGQTDAVWGDVLKVECFG